MDNPDQFSNSVGRKDTPNETSYLNAKGPLRNSVFHQQAHRTKLFPITRNNEEPTLIFALTQKHWLPNLLIHTRGSRRVTREDASGIHQKTFACLVCVLLLVVFLGCCWGGGVCLFWFCFQSNLDSVVLRSSYILEFKCQKPYFHILNTIHLLRK